MQEEIKLSGWTLQCIKTNGRLFTILRRFFDNFPCSIASAGFTKMSKINNAFLIEEIMFRNNEITRTKLKAVQSLIGGRAATKD